MFDQKLPKYMTQEEVETFFSKIKSKRDKALFATIYHYGLRVTEATLLNLDDVDLNRNKIPDFYSLIVYSDSFLLNLPIRSSICFSLKS
jgi:integrase